MAEQMEPLPQRAVFIGDAITGLGYRLAGVTVLTPREDETWQTLRAAAGRRGLVLITAEYAAKVPDRSLQELLSDVHARVVVVPDARDRTSMPSLGLRVRRVLGMEP